MCQYHERMMACKQGDKSRTILVHPSTLHYTQTFDSGKQRGESERAELKIAKYPGKTGIPK